MRDFYYSETLLDFLPHNITDFMFTYQVRYQSFDLQERPWLMFNHERLKFNWLKQSEPTYCRKDPQNPKQQLTKMHGVLKQRNSISWKPAKTVCGVLKSEFKHIQQIL